MKPDPEPQVAQQIPPATSEVAQQVPTNCPAQKSQTTSLMRRQIKPDPESRVTLPMHRPNLPARHPSPVRNSLVQAFRQILAQQNDAEYINVSNGDEGDNY
jgi:hypothetical protein